MSQNFTRYEVEFECRDKNVSADRDIGWTPLGTSVNFPDIGGMQPREFEQNGGIAGIGVGSDLRAPRSVCIHSIADRGSSIK
jgi:hypothetical protein